LYFNIELLSGNKIKNYPEFIPMKIMRIQHYKELKNVSEFEYDIFEPVITSVLDNTIDWNRVDNIKTVDELTKVDRLKLLYFQILNSKGGEIDYEWDCGYCDKSNKITFQLEDLVENKLKNEIKDIEYKSNNGETITIAFPRFKDHLRLDIKIKEYLEKAFKEIEFYIKPVLDLQNRIEEINKKINFAKITANPEITNEDKIKSLEEEMKTILLDLEKILEDDDLQKKVSDILRSKKLYTEEIILIKSYKDLKFIKSQAEDLVYYCYIKNNNRELEDYFLYINDIDARFMRNIEKFIEETYYGFEDEIEISCVKCHKKDKVRLDLSPKFFFSGV
jgi:hypothetical protein